MADDSDYSVPCACGGWISFVYDVQQPHEHYRQPATLAGFLAWLNERIDRQSKPRVVGYQYSLAASQLVEEYLAEGDAEQASIHSRKEDQS